MSYQNPTESRTKPLEGKGILEAEIFVSEAAAAICERKMKEAWDNALMKVKQVFLDGDKYHMYFSDAIDLTRKQNPYEHEG